MRHARVIALGIVAACGGGGAAATTVEEPDPRRPQPEARYEDDEEDDDFDVVSERGKLDPDDVVAVIEPRHEELLDCFLSQVGKRKWLGGSLELRWEVAGDGAIAYAQIASSSLGAWPVEKCILGIARAIEFPAPKGNKAADTSIPLDLPARTEPPSWDDRADAVVSKRIAELDACAEQASPPDGAIVTAYVGTRGKVQEAGFAAAAPIDDAWADCAYQIVMGWTLSDPKGKVVKLSFSYPP